MSWNLRCRAVARTIYGALYLALTINIAQAHEGHDHGPPAPALPAAVKPRVAIQTDLYELVAIADGTTLRVLLDRYDNNAPVTDAAIQIVAGADTVAAEVSQDGTYKAAIAALATPGDHDLIFNVSHKDGDDLLAGTLTVPGAKAGADNKPNAAPPEPLSPWSTISVWALLPVMALGLAVGFIAGRRRPVTLGLLAAALFAWQPVPSHAHEGHEPSPALQATAFSVTPRAGFPTAACSCRRLRNAS